MFLMGKYIDSDGSIMAQMNDYKDYCFDNYQRVLTDNQGKEDFEKSWATEVSTKFDYPVEDVSAIYGTED